MVFAPYDVASSDYRPPFLRVYAIRGGTSIEVRDVRGCAAKEGSDEVSEEHLHDFSPDLPFRLGLLKVRQRTRGEHTYLLAPFRVDRPERFPTRAEAERQKVEEEHRKAEELSSLVDAYRRKFGDLT
ncbi:MAG: hypothetical protein ACTSU5_17780 [Promethearchaeota archaeon]